MTEMAGVEDVLESVHIHLPHSDRPGVARWLLEHADHPWDVVSTSEGFRIPGSLYDKPSGHGDLIVGHFLQDEHGAVVPNTGESLGGLEDQSEPAPAVVPAAVEPDPEPAAQAAPAAARKKNTGKA